MGFWSSLFGRKAITPNDLRLDLLGQASSRSGVRVTWETALQASAAYACARVIADGVAQVPLKLYRARPSGGADAELDHPLYNLAATGPNPWTTSFEWRETAGLHLAITNRSFAYINRVGNARAQRIELFPLTPQQVRIERTDSGASRYFVRFGDGRSEQEIAADAMLHLRGPSWNSWDGIDGVKLAREAIGLALAGEEHGARMFKNGAIVGGILSSEQTLGAEQRSALRDAWHAAQAGLGNAYKTAVLWGGMKWFPRAQPNDQAQWIELRKFQVEEVCRFYRVLPIMAGYSDKTATYASAEQMFLAHAVHTMGPWYRRLEERFDLQLLTPVERAAGLYFKFNANALLRSAHADRAKFYQTLHAVGALSPNEIRALEEMNPYDGGDEHVQPINFGPVGAMPAAADGGSAP